MCARRRRPANARAAGAAMRVRWAVLALALALAVAAAQGAPASPRESEEDVSSEAAGAAAGAAGEDALSSWAASLADQAQRRAREQTAEKQRLATAPPTRSDLLTGPEIQSSVNNNSHSTDTPYVETSNNNKQNEILQDLQPACEEALEDAAGFVRLPGTRSRYKFFAQPAAWAAARARCAREGAHLAVANDQLEALALVFLMRAALFPANPTHMHVGVSDRLQEGVWRTEDGSDFNKTYFRWAKNQPEINNRQQNCMQLYHDLTNVDYNCEGKLTFACEKSLNPNIQS